MKHDCKNIYRCTYYRWDINLFYTLTLSLHPNCISCMLFEVYFQLWINQGIDALGEIWFYFIPYPFYCTQIVYHAWYLKYISSSTLSHEVSKFFLCFLSLFFRYETHGQWTGFSRPQQNQVHCWCLNYIKYAGHVANHFLITKLLFFLH